MKNYQQLTDTEKDKAIEQATGSLLGAILEGALRFDDEMNGDDLQSRIDAACQEAERMHTPWFAHEHIMDTCKEEITGMARMDAEDTMYLEEGESTPIRLGG